MSLFISLFGRIQDLVASVTRTLAPLPPTLARLFLGLAFMGTGWGKLHNLEQITSYFESLHIPAAAIQAPFIAGLEFVGGIALLVGLGTRLFAALLACTMIVAILTAKLGDVKMASDLLDLAGSTECTYLALLVWLAVAGPGPLSLDRLFVRERYPKAQTTASTPA